MSEELDIERELTDMLNAELKKERIKSFEPVRELFDKYNIGSEDRIKIMLESQEQASEYFKKKNQIIEEEHLVKVTISNVERFVKQNKK